jgi:CRISPR-associated protein Cas5d
VTGVRTGVKTDVKTGVTTEVVGGIEVSRDAAGNLPVVVQVKAEAALFSRPELKVERVSYPVMTPSAAIGVLESIYWKPEFRYRIVAIEVLRPLRQFSVRRNETTDVAPLADAVRGTRRVDTVANRDQRNAVCLRDVEYRIHAHIELREHADKPVAAYRDQLRRRVRRGACFQRPYLGTREFSAEFFIPDDTPRLNDYTEDLGIMLHSVRRDGTGRVRMQWFAARVDRGVLKVPERGLELDLPGIESGEGAA